MPVWNEELQQWGYHYHEDIPEYTWLGFTRERQMIQHIKASITYADGRPPREYEQEYVGALSFSILGAIFGDDFWELLTASVLPCSTDKYVEVLREFVDAEIAKRLQRLPQGL